MADEIANIALRKGMVPGATEGWRRIGSFALTFDGYEFLPDGRCGELADAVRSKFEEASVLPSTLDLSELRACLFFEQRRHRHFGHEPDRDAMIYIAALLAAIVARVPGE
jgi:hypothetical protein